MRRTIVAVGLTGLLAGAALADSPHDRPGFVTTIEDGRLWVFQEGSKALEQYREHGEPAVSVSRIGEGPEGMTLRAPSQEVLDSYLSSQ